MLGRLPEWLEYHAMMGVEHFYIYDNGDDDYLFNALVPYILAGLVTHVRWPAISCQPKLRSSQFAGVNSCLRRFAGESEWIAHIDVDDFLIPMGNYKTLLDLVAVKELERPRVDALAFGMIYCAPCLKSSTNYEPSPLDLPYLGRCQCAGKMQDHRNKLIVRTDGVLCLYIHYPVAGFSESRPRMVTLDRYTEAKYLHVRNNFSFESAKAAAYYNGPGAFSRLLKGHDHACSHDNQKWCWLSELTELRARLRIWVKQRQRGQGNAVPIEAHRL